MTKNTALEQAALNAALNAALRLLLVKMEFQPSKISLRELLEVAKFCEQRLSQLEGRQKE
jgi:hypothetical protein